MLSTLPRVAFMPSDPGDNVEKNLEKLMLCFELFLSRAYTGAYYLLPDSSPPTRFPPKIAPHKNCPPRNSPPLKLLITLGGNFTGGQFHWRVILLGGNFNGGATSMGGNLIGGQF